MSNPRYNPALYNSDVAAAFRAQAELLTRRFSVERRFLKHVADALAGRSPAYWAGVQSSEQCVLLGIDRTERYWPLVQQICDAIPAIRWMPTEFVYLGIFAARR